MKPRRALLLSLLCVVISSQSFSQTLIGRQIVDQYPVTSWGFMSYGLTWIPTDYNANPAQKYPLIIFLHGRGETGDGVGGLYNLLGHGIPKWIAEGWNPEAVNPSDGQNHKFIVVSPQAPYSMQWSYDYTHVQWILPDIINRYRIDTSRIYVTGLSAGGQGTWSCVTSGPVAAKKFAAIVPVCSANGAPADSIPKVGSKYGVKLYQACGDQDPFMGFVNSSTALYNSGIPAPVPPAIATPFIGQAHYSSVWNTVYDPTWRSNAYNLNIYEWMIQYKRSPAGTTSLSANAGNAQTITLPLNQVTLTGSGTPATGNTITSYAWTALSGQ